MTQTFIGPIRKVHLPNRVTSYAFDMVQGTNWITLAFADRPTAVKEREQLLGLPHTHRVQSLSLMKAIQQAIEDSSKASPRPQQV